MTTGTERPPIWPRRASAKEQKQQTAERRIPSKAYDRAFFLSPVLEGYDEFLSGELSVVKARQVQMLDIAPGTSLLEIGYGRGELLLHCAKRGARVAGVDYADEACVIARETLSDFPDSDVRVADCRDLPFESDSFDRVFSGDVIEHMPFEDAVEMLREMYRVTRPGGFMLVKTTPNTVFVRYVYPWMRPVLSLIDRNGVRRIDDQLEVMRRLHVDEYNTFSYRRTARQAGLKGFRVWIDPDVTRSNRHQYSERFARSRLVRAVAWFGRLSFVRFFLGNDLYLRCDKPQQ